MKTLLPLSTLALLALGGAARATEFTTVNFQAGNGIGMPNLGESFSFLNDTYTANFTNFAITSSGPFLDAQWTHRFDTTVSLATSPSRPAYGSVTQTVTGTVSRPSGAGPVGFNAILSETITDALGLPRGTGSQQFVFAGDTSSNNGGDLPFAYTLTVPFDGPLAKGFAIKDDLVFDIKTGTVVRVHSIRQTYNPVPEPASLAILGLGAITLLRRRRSPR